jgi:hypothetical protein
MNAAAIARALNGRPVGPGCWLVACPAHDDRNPSLVVSEATNLKDKVFVHCFAGCDSREVEARLQLLGLLDTARASPWQGKRPRFYTNGRSHRITHGAAKQAEVSDASAS